MLMLWASRPSLQLRLSAVRLDVARRKEGVSQVRDERKAMSERMLEQAVMAACFVVMIFCACFAEEYPLTCVVVTCAAGVILGQFIQKRRSL